MKEQNMPSEADTRQSNQAAGRQKNGAVRRVELLAPAGSEEALRAAVQAGCDAVYLGGARFGARAYATNFDETALLRALDYVKLRGKKLHLTVNTLQKDEELAALPEFLAPYYENGLDAVIVQDIGAAALISECFPALPVHLSTQLSLVTAEGVRALLDVLRGQGGHGACHVTRIVPARELTLPEIRVLCANAGTEVELFVHGALCYCYSGQCLMSSFMNGRSGNRGRCGQPCRLPYQYESGAVIEKSDEITMRERHEGTASAETRERYEGAARAEMRERHEGAARAEMRERHEGAACAEKRERRDCLSQERKSGLCGGERSAKGYLLSPKDLCTIERLPELIEAGATAFKIEGRMKQPAYVAGVVRAYREELDRYYEGGTRQGWETFHAAHPRVLQEKRDLLAELYNRGGFTCGYAFEQPDARMMATERPNHSGNRVGHVSKVAGTLVSVTYEKQINAQDYLELRAEDGTAVFSFTSGAAVPVGETVQVRMNPAAFSQRLERSAAAKEQKGVHMRAEDGAAVGHGKCDGTQSFFVGMPVFRMKNAALEASLVRLSSEETKLAVSGVFTARVGVPCCLTAAFETEVNGMPTLVEVSVTGEVPQLPKTQPITVEQIRSRLLRTGDTPFVFGELRVEIEEALFLSAGGLNGLRREALAQLEQAILRQRNRVPAERSITRVQEAQTNRAELAAHEAQVKSVAYKEQAEPMAQKVQTEQAEPMAQEAQTEHFFDAVVGTREQLRSACAHPSITRVIVELARTPFALLPDTLAYAERTVREAGKQLYLRFPRILHMDALLRLRELLPLLAQADGFLLPNPDALSLVSALDKPLVFDFSCYAMNTRAGRLWSEVKNAGGMGAAVTAPLELNARELRAWAAGLSAQKEMIVYGRVPLMVTAQCPALAAKERAVCAQAEGGCGIGYLTDRLGQRTPVVPCCAYGYRVIYNAKTLSLLPHERELREMGVSRLRLCFTVESGEETYAVLEEASGGLLPDGAGRAAREADIEKRTGMFAGGLTRGQYLRGVQ